MAFVVADFVKETTTTTGTGTLTLAGAASGYRTFLTGVGDGNTTLYALIGSDGSWETGIGTVGSGTLARTTVKDSSNSGSAIDLPAGTHTVHCGPIAEVGEKAYSAIQSDPSGITGADTITNIVSLTQAEYDAIGSPSASTLYIITDA